MDNTTRANAQKKLIGVRRDLEWVRKRLIVDEPHSIPDREELKQAKRHARHVLIKLENPYPPKETVTATSYPFFEYDYALGDIPWDLHALNLPFTDVFTWENWVEGAELCAKHNVNLVRFFFASSEDGGFPYILPFAESDRKFNLLDTDCEGYEEIYRRLDEFWKRDIATMICLASGIKDAAGRWGNCVWNGKNNINGTTLKADYFMRDATTRNVLNKLVRHLEQKKGWSEKPVIYEPINEHNEGDVATRNFNTQFVENALDSGVYMNAIAVEYWHSSQCFEFSVEYPVVMPYHGCNHVDAVKRCHRGELQNYFMEMPVMFMLDADGQINNPTEGWPPGVGLVGLKWSPLFRRFVPRHIKSSFIYDYNHSGQGVLFFDASAYYQNGKGNAPNYADWKKANLDGLTAQEVNDWLEWYFEKRRRYHEESGLPMPGEDFQVDAQLFESSSGQPLGTLKMIKQAANAIFA